MRRALLATAVAVAACGGTSTPAAGPERDVLDPTLEVESAPHFIIVVQGTDEWMGTPTYGGYQGLREALDAAASWKPADTVVLLVATGDDPDGRELYGGTIGNISGSALGERALYANDIGVHLQATLQSIEKKLSSEDGRKVMVIIGDGTDVLESFDARAAADRLRLASFEVYSIHLSTPLTPLERGKDSSKILGFSGHRSALKSNELTDHLAAIYREAFGQ